MNNPFDVIDARLSNIENLLLDIKHNPSSLDASKQDEVLTVPEAAKFLSLTIPTIYSLISRREIPHFKRSRRVYFSRDELIGYLKAGRNKTISEIEAEAAQYVTKKRGPK